jgi:trimeric autotransporter adhesin
VSRPSRAPRALRTAAALLVAVSTGLLAVGLVAPAAHALTTITVEAESPTATTMTPGSTANAAASGGRYLFLYTPTAPSTGAYTATYQVTAPAAGVYEFTGVSSPVSVQWASPYTYRINGGAAVSATTATETGTVSSELRSYRYGMVALSAGVNTVTISVDTRRVSPNTNYTLFLDKLTFTESTLGIAAVIDRASLDVFEHGADVGLDAELTAPAPAAVDVAYTVTDYWQQPVASGTAHAATGESAARIALGAGLDTGYYEVSASLPGQTPVTTSFVVTPALADRDRPDDSPFAADLWGSKFVPTDRAEAFAHTLELTGVSWIRDRHRWNDQTNPSSGVFDFSTQAQQNAWLPIAAAAGLKTLSSYTAAPTWAPAAGEKLPQNMLDAYAYAKAVGAEYDGEVNAWEIWNEQNRGFTNATEGADAYAAMAKAAAIGFADSGADVQLIDGGLAGVDPHYADVMYRNGILDYLDGFAYHTHTTDNQDSPLDPSQDHLVQLAAPSAYGGDEKTSWVTESGIALNTFDGSAPDRTQRLAQARHLVADAARAVAAGVDHLFFFIEVPYDEGTQGWGSFGDFGQPFESIAAQSVLTDQLGAAVYAGALPGLPAAVEGYAFDDRGTTATVLFSATPTQVTVDLGAGSATLADIMGHEQALSSGDGEYTIDVGPDPVYVRSAGTVPGLTGTPTASTPADPVVQGGFSASERVVVQQTWPASASANALTDGYRLDAAATTTLSVDVYNLGDSAVTGTLDASSDGGWQLAVPGGTVSVPAHGKTTVSIPVTAGTALEQGTSYVTVGGTFAGGAVSPSVTDVAPTAPSIPAAVHARGSSGDRLTATYTNPSGTARSLVSATWDLGAGPVSGSGAPATVAGGGTATLVSPAVPAGASVRAYTLELAFADGGIVRRTGTVATPDAGAITTVANATQVVDGALDATGPLTELVPTAPGIDPADLSAAVYVSYDTTAFYLSATVTDDVFSQTNTSGSIWRGDGIQFGLAPGWPGETDLRPEIQPRAEFGVALTPSGPQLFRFGSNGVANHLVTTGAVAVTRNPDGTVTYEAAVPWSELPGISAGAVASFSVAVNDSDDGARRGWVNWGDGLTTTKDTATYRPVVFAP